MATLTRGMHSWMSGDLEVLKLERDRQEPGSLRHIMAEMEVAELQKYLAQVEIVSLKTYQGEEEPPSPKRRRMETRQFKGPAVEALPEAATVRMAAASCDISKSDDDSTESRRTSVAPGRPSRASLAVSGWPTMVVSFVAPFSERANGLLPAGFSQS